MPAHEFLQIGSRFVRVPVVFTCKRSSARRRSASASPSASSRAAPSRRPCAAASRTCCPTSCPPRESFSRIRRWREFYSRELLRERARDRENSRIPRPVPSRKTQRPAPRSSRRSRYRTGGPFARARTRMRASALPAERDILIRRRVAQTRENRAWDWSSKFFNRIPVPPLPGRLPGDASREERDSFSSEKRIPDWRHDKFAGIDYAGTRVWCEN